MTRFRIVFTVLAALTFAPTAFAQPAGNAPPAIPASDGGTALFRGLFHFYEVTPTTEIPRRGSRETIVVIFGKPPKDAARLVKSTLEAGGSVLVASKGDIDDLSNYFPDGTARISGPAVTVGNPAEGLGGKLGFPLIRQARLPGIETDFTIAADAPSILHRGDPRFRNPMPSFLSGQNTRYPQSAMWNGERLPREDVFAAGQIGNGNTPYRCFVAADDSILSNRMLYASAIDYQGVTPQNFQFANETVKWLTADGTRTECLFFENGRLANRFDDFDYRKLPPPGMPPDMPMPAIPNPLDRPVQELLSRAVDGALAKVEDANPLPEMLSERPKLYGVLLAGALGAVLNLALAAAIRSGWRARHRPDYLPPPADPLRLGPDAPLGSFEHRRLEILRGGDFRGPVVAYLRRLFAGRGLDVDAAGRVMPAVDATGRNPRQLRHMVRELYDEAFVFDRAPLPYTLWKEIEPAVAAVRAAADAGLWQFRPAPSNAEDA